MAAVALLLLFSAALAGKAQATAGDGGAYSYLTISDTHYDGKSATGSIFHGDNQNLDNEWMNSKEDAAFEVNPYTLKSNADLPTHLIYPYPHYQRRGLNGYPKLVAGADKIADAADAGSGTDTRQPLIVIHGWQGAKIQTNPFILARDKGSSAEKYWANFLAYAKASGLDQKFRIYLYQYPSYKHVSFNARMLAKMLPEVKYIKKCLASGKRISILAHSMGGLVARSLLEEHNGINQPGVLVVPADQMLDRLITLATPHHGSPATIGTWIDSATLVEGLFIKDISTPGANDLYWDDYDGVFAWAHGDLANASLAAILGKDQLNSYRLDGMATFDDVYRQKLSVLLKNADPLATMLAGAGVYYQYPNPWLTWLNEKFNAKPQAYKKRYIGSSTLSYGN